MTHPKLSVSVVSHGQGQLVAALLHDLAQCDWNDGEPFEVIVTLNLPENEHWLAGPFPFPLKVRRNRDPKGFGANHNAAFADAEGEMFVVVNPDIRLPDFHVRPLLAEAARPGVGVCGPLVRSPAGAIDDSARRTPTIARLIRRKLGPVRGPDYVPSGPAQSVDWLAGMFVVFPASAYAAIGGFDERYFMYLEDVEICRTLRARGYDVRWVHDTSVVHDAARASRRSRQHLSWHLRSLARFLLAPARD